jgi:glucosamine--fructose-6-phosphate aminotransferase (isomerizing)
MAASQPEGQKPVLNTALKIVEGRYFTDLMDQPRALDSTCLWLKENGMWEQVRRFVKSREWKRIVITGMGSSYHTLHPLNLSLMGSGFNPIMIETSELIHYGLSLCDEDTLIVAVSQSGRSAEILRLLELNQRAPILAVTNTAGSPLAQAAKLAILIQAGPESSVSCNTYAAGLLALQWLACVFAGRLEHETVRQFSGAGRSVEEYLRHWRQHTLAIADRLHGVSHVFLTGRGCSLAAVGTGALIVKESARYHAEGMSSAAFRHGPIEMLRSDMFTAVFDGEEQTRELNRRLARELTARGQHCESIGEMAMFAPFRIPESNALVRPIVEILPVQMMSLALAGLSQREAGAFEHATKITDRE